MTQNELAHFGVLGMKWGVRRENLGRKGSVGETLNKASKSGKAAAKDSFAKSRESSSSSKLGSFRKAAKEANQARKIAAKKSFEESKAQAKQKKLEKADSKYLRDGKAFTSAFFKAHNYGVDEMNAYIKSKGSIDPRNKKQMAAYTKKYQDSLNSAAKTLGLGVSPSGRYSLQFVVGSEGQPSWHIIDSK